MVIREAPNYDLCGMILHNSLYYRSYPLRGGRGLSLGAEHEAARSQNTPNAEASPLRVDVRRTERGPTCPAHSYPSARAGRGVGQLLILNAALLFI